MSVILPARNEEKYIQECLKTLVEQDYPNYEIIAINDSSTDKTGELIESFSLANSKIVYVNVESKPNDWTGKCWACYQGYLKSTGDLFLFTDADTSHSCISISLAVNHLLSKNLDALTAIPKILAFDFWTKITLPILWTLSLAKYSALHANNPNSKVGYFFGSFFLLTRKTYESIGTHKEVKKEIVEDGALGRKVKEQGFKLNVVHGRDHINAVWARDPITLWNGLRRLMISIYDREKINAYLMAFATFILLLFPLLIFPFSISMVLQYENISKHVFELSLLLLSLILASMLLLIITSVLELKSSILQNPIYSLFFPLSSSFIFIAFLSSIINSRRKYVVSWKDRMYSIKENENTNKQ
ncbi:MAG: glycosyltransferase [Thermoproteota archaeon]|nr:glycosyltransferase [Thermoproteota archaeon]